MSTPLLEVRGLRVEYPARGWGGRRGSVVPALHGLDLALDDGRSLGIVGESGCGKSTLVRSALGLVAPSGGEVRWRGRTVDTRDRARMRQLRREMQVVFQDPFGSLDPRLTAGESVAEALQALEAVTDAAQTRQRVAAALAAVGLDASLASRYPHELSGGQCQRVAIARATIVRPRLLICDEPVSALDVSVQAQIVNLLAELRRRDRTALLFISHNLAVVRHLCEEVAVLYLGRIVERAPRDSLFLAPRHPYTRALLAAVPDPDPGVAARRSQAESPTEVVDRRPAATGCPFAPRCPLAVDRCRNEPPRLESTGERAVAACHRWREAPPAQLD